VDRSFVMVVERALATESVTPAFIPDWCPLEQVAPDWRPPATIDLNDPPEPWDRE